MLQDKPPKNPLVFNCKKCDFNTCNKKDYNRHLTTRKHQMRHNATEIIQQTTHSQFICSCGNVYKHHSSYYRHKKICNSILTIENNKCDVSLFTDDMIECDNDKELLFHLLKENREIKQSMLEQQQMLKKLLNLQNKYVYTL